MQPPAAGQPLVAELILGKIIPFVFIGAFQLTQPLLLMRFLFRIRIAGSVASLYIVGFVFIAAVLGLGMLISTIAQTQMQASQISMFILLPFVFLSGFVFPIGGMPKIFQWISMIVPARYFVEVARFKKTTAWPRDIENNRPGDRSPSRQPACARKRSLSRQT